MIIIILALMLGCLNKKSINFNKNQYKVNTKNKGEYTLKEIFNKLLSEYVEAGKINDIKLKEEKEKSLKTLLNIYNPENAGGYFIEEIQDIIGKKIIDIEVKELLRLEIINNDIKELKNLRLNVKYKNWYELIDLNIENLEALMELGLSIKGLNCSGENLLHKACFDGDLALVNFLISKKLNLNLQEKRFNFTPIFFACLGEHKELLEHLYLKGANIRIKDKNKRNLLQVIASNYFNLNFESQEPYELVRHFLKNDLIKIILNFSNKKDELVSFIHEKDNKDETFYSYIIKTNAISSKSYKKYISSFCDNNDNLNFCFFYFLIYYSEILGKNILDKLIQINEESLIIKDAYELDKDFTFDFSSLKGILNNIENIQSNFFLKYLLEKNFKPLEADENLCKRIFENKRDIEKKENKNRVNLVQSNKMWFELKYFIDRNDFDSFKEKLEDQDFDINYSLNLEGLYEDGMTILHYAIRELKNNFIALILDKNPDIHKRIRSKGVKSSIHFYVIKELVNEKILNTVLKMLNFDDKLECLIYSLKKLNITAFTNILENLNLNEKRDKMSYIFNRVLENFEGNDLSFINIFLSDYRNFIDMNYKKNKIYSIALNNKNFRLFEILLINFYFDNIKEVILDALDEFEDKVVIKFLSSILYDEKENSIVHLVCEMNNEILMKKLLKNDVEINVKNIEGKIPLDICEIKKSAKCKKLLVEYEATKKLK